MKAHPISATCQCEVCEEGRKDMPTSPRLSPASQAIVDKALAGFEELAAEGLIPGNTSLGVRPSPTPSFDPVSHPAHYNSHPSGVECITITQHYNFCLGNVIKYLWRSDLKNSSVEDLKKARWYLDREISNREKSVS